MTFKVMTWNVENLFPVGTRLSANSQPISQAQFDKKLAFLASAVLAEKPDVLALQEIGGSGADDESMLVALQTRLGPAYDHRRAGVPDGRGIRVAFLSKLKLFAPVDIVDFAPGPLATVPNHEGQDPIRRLGRGALSVEVRPSGSRIRIVNTHLKSKLLSYPGGRFNPRDENERAEAGGIALARRTAEAVTLRRHLNALSGDGLSRIILLGDLNDGPDAATSQILLGPADGDIVREDGLDPVRLYNLTDSVPLRGNAVKQFIDPNAAFSRRHEGRGEMLDQILASRELVFRSDDFRVTSVVSLVRLIEGENITGTPGERIGEEGSDHAPVLAEFELD